MNSYFLENGDELVIRMGVHDETINFSHYLTVHKNRNDFYQTDFNSIITKELDNKNKLFLIAKIDGKIVGYVRLLLGMNPMVIHVGEAFLAVAKDYQNLGINKLLIKQLISWAKETGFIRKINIKVRVDDKEKVGFYKKMGFKPEGLLKHEFYSEDTFYDAVIMGRCINPLSELYFRKNSTKHISSYVNKKTMAD
ncbi:acyl-coa n-acyltransferase [Lucifera butyrica]|uniref:Acyl-coa n-acyltransferase n=1 Tax=Lucifera butyrica TaxID=1351585 RepID=A0A498RGC2_9FIRM|nr:GNAT family N-acetyltransferase [Lucifera butyrica]VBB09143.1 acyl-coa n-acyltransferase [Lucifera butyrica]